MQGRIELADKLLVNANIHTMDVAWPWATELAIARNRILAFGDDVRQLAVFGNQLAPPVDNDFDGDDDVDLEDYAIFNHCLSDPEAVPNPSWGGITIQNCLDAFDTDEDGDVDLADFAGVQDAFASP